MRNVEAPLSMTMGVDDGKRAKSASRRGRVTDDISPPPPPAATGLTGSGGEEGFGAFGNLVLFAASSSSSSRLASSSLLGVLGLGDQPGTGSISVKPPVISHKLYAEHQRSHIDILHSALSFLISLQRPRRIAEVKILIATKFLLLG